MATIKQDIPWQSGFLNWLHAKYQQGYQKSTKKYQNELRLAFHCCIFISRKCLRITPFQHTMPYPTLLARCVTRGFRRKFLNTSWNSFSSYFDIFWIPLSIYFTESLQKQKTLRSSLATFSMSWFYLINLTSNWTLVVAFCFPINVDVKFISISNSFYIPLCSKWNHCASWRSASKKKMGCSWCCTSIDIKSCFHILWAFNQTV